MKKYPMVWSIIGILLGISLVSVTIVFQDKSYQVIPRGSSSMMNNGMMWNENNPMKEHWKMMPEMHGYEKYTQTNSSGGEEEYLNKKVLTDDSTTTDEKSNKVINLKNGDTYDLTIEKIRKTINGKSMIMLSYNGSIPWPTIRIPKWSQITLKVHNTIDGIETTVHPHGLRLENQYDGVPKSQWGFQEPIKTWDTYEQKLKFPDAWLFWYHPHTRDDFEQELGEYGTFLVYDPNEKRIFDTEQVIVLDDILLEDGQIPAYSTDLVNHALMGRYGNTFLVNGRTDFSLSMNQWEVKRLYFLNSANARPFRISIPGIKMKLVGSDNGYFQNEKFIDNFIIAPAERYIVDIYADNGGTYPLTHQGTGKPITLWNIIVSKTLAIADTFKNDFHTLHTHQIMTDITNLENYFSKAPDKNITLSMNMSWMSGMGNMGGMMNMGDSDTIEWDDTMSMMNEKSTDKSITWQIIDDATKKVNMDIDWNFQKWSFVKIHIFNDPHSMHPMQHPFHLHGQRFLILDTNGKKNDNLAWKDTVLIPKWDTVDILVDMSNPWTWMAHCHIVEHLLSGMMFSYSVK